MHPPQDEQHVHTVQAVAQEIANNEIKHVELLRTALGDAAVPCPLIDIGSAFVAAANAATNSTLDPPFNPYANNVFFLHAAFIFEDVGTDSILAGQHCNLIPRSHVVESYTRAGT